MKKSKCVALCGMLCALSVVIMLMAYFPYLTFVLPAAAGGILAVIMVEVSSKWAVGAYVASAVLTLLMCEKEAAMLYVAFFGYYPIAKAFLEQIKSRVVEYVAKFSLFNLAVVLAYLVITFVFAIPFEGLGDFGKYTLVILLALANVMFWLYDLCLSQMYREYMRRLHKRISLMLK